MKTPDQVENKESLQPVLRVLKEAAARFNALDQEAKAALQSRQTAATYSQKLEGKAQLLIDLPGRLLGMMEGVDPEVNQQIVSETECFAIKAQVALEGGNFMLGVLLTQQGSTSEDRNELEKLIESLEIKEALTWPIVFTNDASPLVSYVKEARSTTPDAWTNWWPACVAGSAKIIIDQDKQKLYRLPDGAEILIIFK